MFDVLVEKTLRVPASEGPSGDGRIVAQQLSAVLARVGFLGSRALLEHVAGLERSEAVRLSVATLSAARKIVGDHVSHNAYFKHFPTGVPETVEFWRDSLRGALVGARVTTKQLDEILSSPGFSLLSIPTYGRYQHTFEELVAAHEVFVEAKTDRLTVLHLGGTLDEEITSLYLQLAGSAVPLSEGDRKILGQLALERLAGPHPEVIPVRENRALINALRLVLGRDLLGVDTVTDVLRIMAAASDDGDVTLERLTRFRNFARPERRALLLELHRVLLVDWAKVGDVVKRREVWKRAAKALHPHDYPQYTLAVRMFEEVVRDKKIPTPNSSFEQFMVAGDVVSAARALSVAPGALVRQTDQLLRNASSGQFEGLLSTLGEVFPKVSARVLLSLREHLINRNQPQRKRVFVGRSKRAKVVDDMRPVLPSGVIARAARLIDEELLRRAPSYMRLVIDPAMFGEALSLSGKATENGFAVKPRGSHAPLDTDAHDTLRFFTYWREQKHRTDFDLSVLMLDKDFQYVTHVSYTRLRDGVVTHSGDITESRNGAAEFIDVVLSRLDPVIEYVIPQVNVFAGEGFDEVAESLFGYQMRHRSQKGMPFEPRTVRMRSELRGDSRIALPLVFSRGDGWSAKWLHLFLKGDSWGNRVESNMSTTTQLVRAILERKYLKVGYLTGLLMEKAAVAELWDEKLELEHPVTFVGREVPDGLPEGSEIVSPERLIELLVG
ncbi:MAG: TerD family protein [Candidatus Nanopelagicales bacterium]